MSVISIAHSKGGVGKSLLTLNLAPLYKKLLIIDLDTQNSVSEINAVRDHKHLVHTAKNQEQLFKLLDQYEDTHDILIDCGGIDSDMNRLAMSNSHIVVTPVKDNSFEILAFRRFLEIIEKLKSVSEFKTVALINNVHPNTKDFDRLKSIVSKNGNVELLNTIIRSRADLSNQLDYGTTAVEDLPDSKAALEVKELYKELKGLL